MNIDVTKCPVCHYSTLLEKKKERAITYLEVKGTTKFYYTKCTTCGTEVVEGWRVMVNKDNMLTFHRMVEKNLINNS